MTTQPKVHHLFGPSSLGRRYACPGSYREERDRIAYEAENGEDSGEPWAAEGTMLHLLTERVLRHGWDEISESVEPSHVRLVEAAVGFVRARIRESGAPDDVELDLERTVWVRDGDEALIFGTLDCGWSVGDEAFVVDHKFGYQLLDRGAAAFQIGAYLAGYIQHLRDRGVRRGSGWLYLPRFDTAYDYTLGESDVPAAVATIRGVIDRCEDDGAPLVVGQHCRYCLASGKCPASATAFENFRRMA